MIFYHVLSRSVFSYSFYFMFSKSFHQKCVYFVSILKWSFIIPSITSLLYLCSQHLINYIFEHLIFFFISQFYWFFFTHFILCITLCKNLSLLSSSPPLFLFISPLESFKFQLIFNFQEFHGCKVLSNLSEIIHYVKLKIFIFKKYLY